MMGKTRRKAERRTGERPTRPLDVTNAQRFFSAIDGSHVDHVRGANGKRWRVA